MACVWNFEGVTIHETISAKFEETYLVVSGVGTIENRPFSFKAYVTAIGWLVKIHMWSGPKKGEFQGATFNLPLEVATAAKRLL